MGPRPCYTCGKLGHLAKGCLGRALSILDFPIRHVAAARPTLSPTARKAPAWTCGECFAEHHNPNRDMCIMYGKKHPFATSSPAEPGSSPPPPGASAARAPSSFTAKLAEMCAQLCGCRRSSGTAMTFYILQTLAFNTDGLAVGTPSLREAHDEGGEHEIVPLRRGNKCYCGELLHSDRQDPCAAQAKNAQ